MNKEDVGETSELIRFLICCFYRS